MDEGHFPRSTQARCAALRRIRHERHIAAPRVPARRAAMAAARQALRLQPGGTAASVRGGGGEDALAVSEPTVEEQPRSAFVAIFQLPASSVGTTLEDGTRPET